MSNSHAMLNVKIMLIFISSHELNYLHLPNGTDTDNDRAAKRGSKRDIGFVCKQMLLSIKLRN